MRDEFPRVIHTDEPLWTLEEVAAYLRVSERTIRRWVRLEVIPCVRFGAPDSDSHRPRKLVRFEPGVVRRWASGKGGPK